MPKNLNCTDNVRVLIDEAEKGCGAVDGIFAQDHVVALFLPDDLMLVRSGVAGTIHRANKQPLFRALFATSKASPHKCGGDDVSNGNCVLELAMWMPLSNL